MWLRQLFLVSVALIICGCPSRDFGTNVTVPNNWVINSSLVNHGLAFESVEGLTAWFITENLDLCTAVKTHDNDSITIWLTVMTAKSATVHPFDIVLKTEAQDYPPSIVSVGKKLWGSEDGANASHTEVLHIPPCKRVLIKLAYQVNLPNKFRLKIGGIEVDDLPVPIPPIHFRLEERKED